MALVDVMINGVRIPHLVKHEVSEDEDAGKTETYDCDIPEEGTITGKFSLSGIIVDGYGANLTEAQLKTLTDNRPGGHQIICKDYQIKTMYTYNSAMRKSWKNSRDGKKRPTRDLVFESGAPKVENF